MPWLASRVIISLHSNFNQLTGTDLASNPLFDDFISAAKQRVRKSNPERFRGFQIEH
jgi:hypothetical protein